MQTAMTTMSRRHRKGHGLGWLLGLAAAVILLLLVFGSRPPSQRDDVTGFALESIEPEGVQPEAKHVPEAWICVTRNGFCATQPLPTGDPCSCYDNLTGNERGRVVHVDESGKVQTLRTWRGRGPGAGDEIGEGWLYGP